MQKGINLELWKNPEVIDNVFTAISPRYKVIGVLQLFHDCSPSKETYSFWMLVRFLIMTQT